MLDKIDQQIKHPRLEPHQPPGLAKLIVLWVERVVVKGVTHCLSPSSHTLGRCDAGPPGPPHPWPSLPPAVLQHSSANPQPTFSPSSAHPQAVPRHLSYPSRCRHIEPDDADACRGYVSYRTSTLKTIPGNRYGAAAITELSPDDSALVVTTVVDRLRCGRLAWLGKTIEPLGQSLHGV